MFNIQKRNRTREYVRSIAIQLMFESNSTKELRQKLRERFPKSHIAVISFGPYSAFRIFVWVSSWNVDFDIPE